MSHGIVQVTSSILVWKAPFKLVISSGNCAAIILTVDGMCSILTCFSKLSQ
nr:hypothetical protein [Mycoplasma mycoides]